MNAKQKLVVIGNGMAGARTVEEILARGGAGMFDITMFGDEPTGNYNRILLSNVLNGSDREDEIYLNPLAWYRENQITLLTGLRATGLLRRARLVFVRHAGRWFGGHRDRGDVSERPRTAAGVRELRDSRRWHIDRPLRA